MKKRIRTEAPARIKGSRLGIAHRVILLVRCYCERSLRRRQTIGSLRSAIPTTNSLSIARFQIFVLLNSILLLKTNFFFFCWLKPTLHKREGQELSCFFSILVRRSVFEGPRPENTRQKDSDPKSNHDLGGGELSYLFSCNC